MADKNIPNLDAVDYTDMDPQSARASQGFNTFLDSGKQTSDAIEPESSPIDTVVSFGVGPLTDTLASGAERIIGNEIGSIGSNIASGDSEFAAANVLARAKAAFRRGEISKADAQTALDTYKASQSPLGSVANDINQSNIITDSSGAQLPAPGGKPNFGKVTVIPDAKPNYGKVIQKFADGGAVDAPPPGFGDDSLLNSTQPITASAPPAQMPQQPSGMLPEGFDQDPEVEADIKETALQNKYGDTTNQVKAGLEGVAQGVAGPLATAGELALGVKPEDIRGREEANPYISRAGQIAGLGGSMLTGIGEGSLALKTGEAAAGLIRGTGLASKVGAAAADGALQSMLISGGDQITKALRDDPDYSMQAAVTNVGLSGLMGGGLSGALGTVNPLWKATFGDEGSQLIKDFNARMAEHATGADPVAAVTKELGDHWESTNAVSDPVYGSNGLKAQEIAKAMPEFHEGMTEQATSLSNKLQDTVNDMNAKPNKFPPRFADKLSDVANQLQSSLVKSEQPADIFNALQDAKQTLQSYAKFDKFVTPIDEGHAFVNAAKKLQYEFRTALEDNKVWDQAAKAQKDINAAASDFFQSSKDFQSKFTIKLHGEQVIDPGKINTYMNQLGKPNAEIRTTVLDNYLKASQKYRDKISDIHTNLGIDNPIESTSLNATMQTLNKPSTGQKLADALVAKGLQSAGGKGVGAAIGSMIGSKAHVPGGEFLGAMVGSHVLGPFISSIMPLIAKPLMENATNSAALKSATDASMAMIRGQGLVNRATKALFQAGKDVLPSALSPSAAKLAKLDKLVKAASVNPETLTEGPNNIAHYLPNHGTAAAAITGKAVTYLAPLRPNQDPKAPLDGPRVPSTTAIANYNRQLAHAEQPLSILSRIKDGSLTSKDLLTVQTIYPDLYKQMAMQIMDSMTDHLNKGKAISYQTRMGLSKFAAQPLDSTMTPNSIMAAQPQPQSPQPPGEQPGKGKPRKGAGGTALNKLSSSYQTSTQALAARHEKSE